MTKQELSVVQDKIKQLADLLNQDEQKILYLYLFRLGHRIHDSQMFQSKILRNNQ